MDNTVDPAVEVVSLRAMVAAQSTIIADLRRELSAMQALAVIDGARMKRLERELADATAAPGRRCTDKVF